MTNQNLYITQDPNNDNLIRFYLIKKDPTIDLEEINKYNFVIYKDNIEVYNDHILPDGKYHKIEFQLSDLKSELLKEKVKEFIESTFSENVNNESEFMDLLKNLIEFFSKAKKTSEIKFMENSVSLLLFLNWCLDNNLIKEDFLEKYYDNYDDDFDKLTISENHQLVVNNKKNLNILYDSKNKTTDYISISYNESTSESAISIIDLFNKLNHNGIRLSTKFIDLKEQILGLEQSIINKIKITNINDTECYFYDHEDLPKIEIIELNKCKKITFGMQYSLYTSIDKDKEEFKEKLKLLFSN